MNKEQLIEQCLTENPVMIQTINDVEYTLTEDERIAAANAWADMKIEQAAESENAADKAALLTRLGITADEAKLLLG
jgi:hypothetical protein